MGRIPPSLQGSPSKGTSCQVTSRSQDYRGVPSLSLGEPPPLQELVTFSWYLAVQSRAWFICDPAAGPGREAGQLTLALACLPPHLHADLPT